MSDRPKPRATNLRVNASPTMHYGTMTSDDEGFINIDKTSVWSSVDHKSVTVHAGPGKAASVQSGNSPKIQIAVFDSVTRQAAPNIPCIVHLQGTLL